MIKYYKSKYDIAVSTTIKDSHFIIDNITYFMTYLTLERYFYTEISKEEYLRYKKFLSIS